MLADTLAKSDGTLTYIGTTDANMILAGSDTPAAFRCQCGIKFERKPRKLQPPFLCRSCSLARSQKYARAAIQDACPKVSEFPDLLELWNDDTLPHEVCAQSNERFQFKCSACGNQWPAACCDVFHSQTTSSRGCPACRKRILSEQSPARGGYILGRGEPWETQPAELYLVKFDSFYGFGFSTNSKRKYKYGKKNRPVAYATHDIGRIVREAELELIALCPGYAPTHPSGVRTEWLSPELIHNWWTVAEKYGLSISVVNPAYAQHGPGVCYTDIPLTDTPASN